MHHEVENSAKLLWNSTRNTILEEEGIVGITRETFLRALIILCVLCYDDAELLSTFMSPLYRSSLCQSHFTELFNGWKEADDLNRMVHFVIIWSGNYYAGVGRRNSEK